MEHENEKPNENQILPMTCYESSHAKNFFHFPSSKLLK